jgi:hypothetical protein
MNIIVLLNGEDITASCLITDTQINYDSTKRLTTAQVTIMGESLTRFARYDYAHYDQDQYSINLKELYEVTILDGRDGVTKLFDGQITVIEMDQSDAAGFQVFYKCSMNDWSAWLDRAVCWNDPQFSLVFPSSDQAIITALIGHFCPQVKLGTIAKMVPIVQKYDWATKTCRQVLDDMATLAMAEWRVDFNGVLTYGPASAAPAAPYALSTTPDTVSTFPVRVEQYKHDFSNPINTCYVRGAIDPATGLTVQASYQDPISVQQYGVWSSPVVDTQITTSWDASLRAKSTVLANAYPIETGNFIIWTDGLQCGMAVSITEDNIGITGTYWIRALQMNWEDPWTVKYTAQFGSAQPDLETVLRLIAQRAAWATSVQQAGTPTPGSVTDASIGQGGLSATSINSVYANTLVGPINATNITTVNASAIVGQVGGNYGGNISTVNAGSIQGVITSGQGCTVQATTITGVVVSSQLASGIISDLSKYTDSLRPVPIVQTSANLPTLPNSNYPPNSFFYYQPDGHFYQINAAGTGWSQNDSPQNTRMSFYHIGAMSAYSIVGLIVAAQIQSVTAGSITGQITAGQIATVNMSSLSGVLSVSNAGRIDVGALQGQISASQIASVNATSITGPITSDKIGSVNAGTITLGSMSVGATGATAINVYNGSMGIIAQIGVLSGGGYGGWFQVFGAGGTSYSTANVYTDTGGNLFLRQVNFNMTVSGFSIVMTPTTFDPSYSSLAIQVTGGGDAAWHVSRGMTLYSGGTNIGSFVRLPAGGGAQLELTGSGSNYVLITSAGGVRSDQGFTVGGFGKVINSSGQFVGMGVLCTGYGVAAAGFNPYVGGVQYNGVQGLTAFKSGDSPQKTIYVAGGCIVNIV